MIITYCDKQRKMKKIVIVININIDQQILINIGMERKAQHHHQNIAQQNQNHQRNLVGKKERIHTDHKEKDLLVPMVCIQIIIIILTIIIIIIIIIIRETLIYIQKQQI